VCGDHRSLWRALLARGGAVERLEGNAGDRLVIVEFPDMCDSRRFTTRGIPTVTGDSSTCGEIESARHRRRMSTSREDL